MTALALDAHDLDATDLDALASAVRSWSAGRGVELAAAVPVRGGGLGPPLLLETGGLDRVTVTPATLYAPLLWAQADAGILVHTHVDARPPGGADLAVTRRLVAAGALLGVPLLAHLVVGPSKWWDVISRERQPHRGGTA